MISQFFLQLHMSYVLTYFKFQSSVSIKRIDEFLNSEDNLVPIQTPGGFSGNNNGNGNGIRLLQPPPPSLSNNEERNDNLQVKSSNQRNGLCWLNGSLMYILQLEFIAGCKPEWKSGQRWAWICSSERCHLPKELLVHHEEQRQP